MTRCQAQLGPKKTSGVMHNKAIIFDLDMTLVDSSEAESDRNSGNWPETYELIPEFPLADGFDVLFDAIKTNGIRHCVVTNSPRRYCQRVLAHCRLEPEFAICYHDTTEHKPDPEPILKALNTLKLDKSDVICVGDNPNDLLAAKDAGVRAISILQLAKSGDFDTLITQSDQTFFDLFDLAYYLPDCFDFRSPPVKHEVTNHPFLEFRDRLDHGEHLDCVYCLGYRFGDIPKSDIVNESEHTDGHTTRVYELKEFDGSRDILDLTIVQSFIWAIRYLDLPHPITVIPILGSGDVIAESTKTIPSVAKTIGLLEGFDYHPEVLSKVRTYAPLHLTRGNRREIVENSMHAKRFPGLSYGGGCVLLIDDIVTSGNTMNEAARAIKATNGSKVLVFGAAFAKWDYSNRYRPTLNQYNYPANVGFNCLIVDSLIAIKRQIQDHAPLTPITNGEAAHLLKELRERIWLETETQADTKGILKSKLLHRYVRRRVTSQYQWEEAVKNHEVHSSHMRYLPEIFKIIRSIEPKK